MVNFLRKLFIKDYNDIQNNNVREAHGKLAGFFGVVSNFILFGVKFFAGIISSSISIIADSINNLSDMASSIITLIGFKLANAPADEEHPYGHQRLEYITGLIVSIIIIFVGGNLLITSIDKIMNFEHIEIPREALIISIIILSCSIIVKFIQAFVNKRIGTIINSVALEATAKDSLNDCLSTGTLLVGNIFLLFFPNLNFSLDGVLGVLVSLFIIIAGIRLIKETIDPLIGVSTDSKLVKEIIDVIKEDEYVLGYHDIVCHMYGPTKCFMTIHVEVDANQSMLEVHDSIDNIERRIAEEFGVELTIHMDPIQIDNEEINILRKRVVDFLLELDPVLSMHDFRVVIGPTHTNLIFDVVKPFKFKLSEQDILKRLQESIKDDDKQYYFVVHFDNNYMKVE